MKVLTVIFLLVKVRAFLTSKPYAALGKTGILKAVDRNGMPIFEYPSMSPVVDAIPTPMPSISSPVASSPMTLGTSGDPISAIDASQQVTMNKIVSAIPDLAQKPDLSWTTSDGITIGGQPVILDGRDAAGSSNIAWLANVKVDGKMSSLTIFNGPLTNVPHLLSRCIVNDDGTISFALDFRPRAYGAYEMRDDQGNYPGPDVLGRNAFTYSGNRKEYDTKFGTSECVSFIQSTMISFEEAIESSDLNEYESLTKGPLSLKVIMPLTDRNVQAVIAAREMAANFWLKWSLENTHSHRPGAPVNSQYVYDTKFRQNAYAALLTTYKAVLGPDGASLAMAESGPLDEAYVGGGS